MPFSSRVDSITNFLYSYTVGDELVVGNFIIEPLAYDAETLALKRMIALNEPVLLNRAISKTADVTGINVNVIFDKKTPDDVASVAEFARNLAAQFEQQYPFLHIYVTGSIMFDTAFSEVGHRDMKRLAPLMFIVLVVMIGLALRSWIATLLTSLIIVLATMTAMGLAGWLGISINPASASAPTIILILAVADSVHILVMYCRRLCAGEDKNNALVKTLNVNLQAVFLTSITTAVGFLTMNFSNPPPFHDLGNIVAMGVIAALVYSVLLLPALLVLVPMTPRLAPPLSDEKLFSV